MWLKLLITECGFSMQVDDGAQLELEDGVTFTGGVAALTGAYKATTVGFLMTAADRSNQRELGQVVHRPSSSWLPVGKGQMGTFPKSRSHAVISSHSEIINRPAHSKAWQHICMWLQQSCVQNQHISIALLLHMPYATSLR